MLPVANNCKHSQFAKRNCDVDNIFAPEHRQGRLMELSAAVGFLRGIHFIKITARFRRGMAGRQRLINIARRHGVNNIGSLNLIIRKDSQHAACAAVIGGDDA